VKPNKYLTGAKSFNVISEWK